MQSNASVPHHVQAHTFCGVSSFMYVCTELVCVVPLLGSLICSLHVFTGIPAAEALRKGLEDLRDLFQHVHTTFEVRAE